MVMARAKDEAVWPEGKAPLSPGKRTKGEFPFVKKGLTVGKKFLKISARTQAKTKARIP